MGVTINDGNYALTISNGQQNSQALSSILTAGQLKLLGGAAIKAMIVAPATLSGSITVQVPSTEGGTDWSTLQINGTDALMSASKANLIPMGAFRDFRLHSSSAEGADRLFGVTFQLGTA